ncbi:ARM repeat-containing protein [Fistulina hepatica ATCC 64428]|nr:ARM repeat-containing protein [Fistulina hepatica ATCC 64428]
MDETVEEDFSSLPIPERLAHKSWKARVSAYESLAKAFAASPSESDPVFAPYKSNGDLVRKIACDSNVVAQEKGLECVLALLTYGGLKTTATREVLVPALVDKALGSTRAATKARATDILLQYVALEDDATPVVTALIPGLSAKQPKTVAGCVAALVRLVQSFGVQVVPPQPLLKVIPRIFAHSDKNVRAEGTSLVHALYTYIGPAVEPALADLKPVQQKDLRDAFATLTVGAKPERLTLEGERRAEAENAEDAADADAEVADEEPAFDPRAFAEAIDVGEKLPSLAPLASSKWKERKELLDELLALLSTPKISPSPALGDLAKALATRVEKDANVNCVVGAAQCIEALCKGLASGFRSRETVVPPMLERLKERKTHVTDVIGAALDAVFATDLTALSALIGDIQHAFAHKNPQVREGTLKYLARSLSAAKTSVEPSQIKPLSESLAGLLEDGYEGARNEAALCLGTLMKMVGERPLNPVMESLQDVRKAKVREAYEKATVKCKAGGIVPKPPPPAAKAPPSKKLPPRKPGAAKKAAEEGPKPDADDEGDAPSPPKTPAAAKPSASKPPAAKSAAKPAAKPTAAAGKGKGSVVAASDVSVKFKHTPEDADTLAVEHMPASILADLADANWKIRLQACDDLQTWIVDESGLMESQGGRGALDAEVVVRAIGKKGWAEKNFQVSAKLYGVLTTLAGAPTFGRSSMSLAMPHLIEKLGDMKLKKPAGDLLALFAEKSSLGFVLGSSYAPLAKLKAPKMLADALGWIDSVLREFGVQGVGMRDLIDCLKTSLGNSNAVVRTSATKTLVTVRLYAGADIFSLLEDLNPQLMATIQSEFAKVNGEAPPEPTRKQADIVAGSGSDGSAGGGGGVGSGDPLEELFPRLEIDTMLKGTTILASAKSDAWKTKKEGLEQLQAVLGDHPRLKSGMGDIGQVLKARVVDSNKAVQVLALDIVGRIATGMGKPFEKQCRLFVLPICTCLTDQKANIRNSALAALSAIAEACEGLEPMVPGIASSLESSNPLQKGTLLGWLADWFKSEKHSNENSLDISGWVGPIVSALDDRNPDVRKGAQAMLVTLIASAGYDYVMHQTNSLKPASRASAVPLIQAAAANTPAKGIKPLAKENKPPTSLVKAKVPSGETNVPTPPSPLQDDAPPRASVDIPKITSKLGVRKKLPQAQGHTQSGSTTNGVGGIKRPGVLGGRERGLSNASPTNVSPAVSASTTNTSFHSASIEGKKNRIARERDISKWVNEGGATRKDLFELLQVQYEAPGSKGEGPNAGKALVAKLFSRDHNAVNDHVAGLAMLAELYDNASAGSDDSLEAIALANIDLTLKYVSIKVHEPQSNLVSRCLDVVESVLAFLKNVNYQLMDGEAQCFIPTIVHKLGDGREPVRLRVSQIIQTLRSVYAYSRLFQMLLDHGLKSKVAKTRQGALDEMGGLLQKFQGIGACEPARALPAIAAMISDKDSAVRKSALGTLSDAYALVGEKVWSFVGPLTPKDRTQLEERLRRVAGPSVTEETRSPLSARAGAGIPRPASPASRIAKPGGVTTPGVPPSRLARPASPAMTLRSLSPTPAFPRSGSPVSGALRLPAPPSPGGRSRIGLPSRLGRLRSTIPKPVVPVELEESRFQEPEPTEREDNRSPASDGITIIISSILSSDPTRSVDALKKIQKILSVGADEGPSSPQYQELAEHTEGLIETITLQMAHVFERPDELLLDENFRLAKHLIQTLNNFCDHSILVENLTVDILTALLEELTLRLLETDDSTVKKVKDLSRFINMIILRLFATGRRMSIFRALFSLLLQIVKPFPNNGTTSVAKEARVAELVLKCVWKLARNIPQDLTERHLDPVELFPAIEYFLQSIPPNEWRARATNKVPCGDMPLRTIKVIIQHVVAHYADDVYDVLSAAFDDPSATIVYPYVYRILNSTTRAAANPEPSQRNGSNRDPRTASPVSSRPMSPQETVSSAASFNHRSPSRRTSPGSSFHGGNGTSPPVEEPDPDAQLLVIIGHISSETTGALHKEGITELHHFLKAYPHKRPRVEKMLESTGAAFRKYINRALASRAAEDQERDVAVADTLSNLSPRSHNRELSPNSIRALPDNATSTQDKLSRLHDIFQYRSSTLSASSSQGRSTPSATRTSLS